MIKIAVRLLKRLIVIPITCFVLLVSSFLLPIASPVNAQEPTIPEPCKNAIRDTDVLTRNYVTNSDGNDVPDNLIINVGGSGPIGTIIDRTGFLTFQVDFSKLQSVFGASNSDYLEGEFLEEEHQVENILDLNTQDFNKFHAAGQKSTPKSIVDDLKVGYVQYIYDHPKLPEAVSEYTDINGEGNPQRIYDLVEKWGIPLPPKAGDDREQWLEKWGKYWPKIPTSYNEFYVGELWFFEYEGTDAFELAKIIQGCTYTPTREPIEFVMPEFKRTVGITNQLNQVIVPCAAQSFRHGSSEQLNECKTLAQSAVTQNQQEDEGLIAGIVNFCKSIINRGPKALGNKIRDAVKISLNKLNPIKSAFAEDLAVEEINGCLKLFKSAKKGSAPFCALPEKNSITGQDQLQPGDTCHNYVDNFKLDPQNPRVVCTFQIQWTFSAPIDRPEDVDIALEDDNIGTKWDSCSPSTINPGEFDCIGTVRVVPAFDIPFLGQIWNNSFYSDESEKEVRANQDTGRPGIYSYFIPKAISDYLFNDDFTREDFEVIAKDCTGNNPDDLTEKEACLRLLEELDKLIKKYPDIAANNPCDHITIPRNLTECFGPYWGKIPSKKLPAQSAREGTDNQVKQKFTGAVQCAGPTATRDFSLKPLALQKELGITSQVCALEANAPPKGVTPGGPGDQPLPPVTDCTSASDGDPSNGTETSREELECYIIDIASGEIDPLSRDNLADLMRRMMGKESNGNQCAVGGDDEIGVFQYTALTWISSSEVVMGSDLGSDSGSGDITTQSRPACWGIPGEDPNLHPTDLQKSWEVNFGASNIDGGAWDPFKQIRAAREKILDSGACIWSSYSGYGYADRSQGLHPEQCFL